MTDQLGCTPSQTVGPFLSIALPWPDGPDAVAAGAAGAVIVHGVMYDGAGDPVPDGMVESWQAAPPVSADFRGFARSCTAPDGSWWIRTLVPGPVDGQPPHLDLNVFARGLLKHLVTRVYFDANGVDARLVAQPDGAARFRFDIRLQGAGETPFFTV